MMAGVPGTGIGGIFYLLSAFLMPIREIPKLISGKSSRKRWGRILIQLLLAGGVMVGFWLTGCLVGMILNDPNVAEGINSSRKQLPNLSRVESFYLSLVTLGTVLFSVQTLSIISRLKFFKKINKK